jgi:hypothetical protein
MHRGHLLLFYTITYIWLLANTAEAVLIALRHAENERTNFSVGSGKEFDLEVFIDPQGTRVTGFQIYLSFDDKYLRLIDATDKLTGLQPVRNGPAYPTGWQPLDNDTHGDPGNILRNFQIDYAAALMAIGDDISVLDQPGVVGIIKFKTLQPVKDSQITFDFIERVSRVTGVIIDQLPRRNFSALQPAAITVRGTVDFKDSFPPRIKFPMNTEHSDLRLDDYLIFNNPNLSSKEMARSIQWEASNQKNIQVKIDLNSRRVTFSPKPDWFGKERIRFTVTDPEGNPSSKEIGVQVTAPPTLLFDQKLPAKGERIRVNSGKNFNLNAHVEDLDNPGLAGLSWQIGDNPDADNLLLNLVGSYLKVEGTRLGTFEIPISVTDSDGNTDQQLLTVLFIPEFDGPVIDPLFPKAVVSTNDGSKMEPATFNLNDLIADFDFEDVELKWDISGAENIKVNVDPETRDVTFENLRNWTGTERLTFRVTNPNEISDQVETEVQLIDKNAPPSIIPILPIELDFGQEKIIDLKKHIFDLDSSPEQIEWLAEGQKEIQIKIDENNIARFQSESVVEEIIRLYAIDPNGLQDLQDVTVTVKKPESPVLVNFPKVVRIKSNDTTIGKLKLDDHVEDPTTADTLIVWQIDGYDKSKLEIVIEADRQVSFTTLPSWETGSEEVIFTAINKAELSSSAVVMVKPMFPPQVSLDQYPALAIYQGEKKTINDLDLDDYLQDADTQAEDINWSNEVVGADQNNQLIATINPNTHKVELSAGNTPVGDYRIEFTATDPEGNTDSDAINVLVLKSQRPPELKIPPIDLIEGEAKDIDLGLYVTDDEPIEQITWGYDNNDKLLVTLDGAVVKIVNQPDFTEGDTWLVVKAIDLDGKSGQQEVKVTVKKKMLPLEIRDFDLVEFEQGAKSTPYDLKKFIEGDSHPKDAIKWGVKSSGQPNADKIQVDGLEIGLAVFSTNDPKFVGKATLTIVATIEGMAPVERSLQVKVKEKIEKPPKPKIQNAFQKVELEIDETNSPIKLNITPQSGQVTFDFEKPNQLVAPKFDHVTKELTLTGQKVGQGKFTFWVVDDFQQQSEKVEIEVTVKEKVIPLTLNLPTLIELSGNNPEKTIDLSKWVGSKFAKDELVWEVIQQSQTVKDELINDSKELKISLGNYDPLTGPAKDEVELKVTEPPPSGKSVTGKISIKVLETITEPKPPTFIKPFPVIKLQREIKTRQVITSLGSYVKDEDTPIQQIHWIPISSQNVDARKENDSLILELIPREPRVAQQEETGQEEASSAEEETILMIASDPEGKKAYQPIQVRILSAPKRKAKCEIFGLPDPIQQKFYIITVVVKDRQLEADPMVTVNDQPQLIRSVGDQIWSLIYPLNTNLDKSADSLKVEVHSGDDEQNSEKIGSKTITVVPPFAPNYYGYLSVGQISAYPNPVQQAYIRITCVTAGEPQLRIYSVDGRLVTTLTAFRPVRGRWEMDWNLTNSFGEVVTNGLYFGLLENQVVNVSALAGIRLLVQR